MSRYPSIAELAAFRRTFRTLFSRRGGRPAFATPDHGGAWDFELAGGIGLVGWSMPNVRSARARREVSELRHWWFMEAIGRARPVFVMGVHPGLVQAIGQTPVQPGDRWYVAAWEEEKEHGCPAWGAVEE